MQGSNDNLQWTVVGSESNQSGWGQWETRIFSVSNPDSYRYYKLVISDNNGGNIVGVGEIQLFETLPHDNDIHTLFDLNESTGILTTKKVLILNQMLPVMQ